MGDSNDGSPVFDSSNQTERAVRDPRTDHTLPGSGSMSYQTITSDTAVAGTNGIDANLCHGNRWQQIDGNVDRMVNQNETRTILSNEMSTTTGNDTRTVVGSRSGTQIGSENNLNVAPRNNTFAASLNNTNGGPRQQTEGVTFMDFIPNDFKFVGISNKIYTQKTDISPSAFTLYAMKYDLGVVMGKACVYEMKTRALTQKVRALGSDLAALKPSALALITHLAITEPDVIPLKANAGIHIAADTPFG